MCNIKKTRLSKLTRLLLNILNEDPETGYTLEGLAEEIEKRRHGKLRRLLGSQGPEFDRSCAMRASLSRLLNRLLKSGQVTYFYHSEEVEINGKRTTVPDVHKGKYWQGKSN